MDIDEAFDVLERIQDDLQIPEDILLEMSDEDFEETLAIFLDDEPSERQFDRLNEAREELAE